MRRLDTERLWRIGPAGIAGAAIGGAIAVGLLTGATHAATTTTSSSTAKAVSSTTTGTSLTVAGNPTGGIVAAAPNAAPVGGSHGS